MIGWPKKIGKYLTEHRQFADIYTVAAVDVDVDVVAVDVNVVVVVIDVVVSIAVAAVAKLSLFLVAQTSATKYCQTLKMF